MLRKKSPVTRQGIDPGTFRPVALLYIYICTHTNTLVRGRYSDVGTATRYTLDGTKFEPRYCEVVYFTCHQLDPGTKEANGIKAATA